MFSPQEAHTAADCLYSPAVSYIAFWEPKTTVIRFFKIFLQVHMAAFPLPISVAAERMSNLLMPMNNLDSNICTFILWAAPFQHPANKRTKSLAGPVHEAGRWGSLLSPQISCDPAGLLHFSFCISSASLRIIHISLPVFCPSLF